MGFSRLHSAFPLAIVVTILVTLVAPAESFDLAAKTRFLPTKEISIVVPASLRGDAALSLALEDLTGTLTSSGLEGKIVDDSGTKSLQPYAIVVGDERNSWIGALQKAKALSLPSLADEGYVIRSIRWEMKPLTVVSGKGDLGSVYGVFKLVEQLKVDPSLLFGSVNLIDEPKIPLRLVSTPTPAGTIYPSPEDALRWGFNAVAIEPWTRLPLYDGFDPRLLDGNAYPLERAWVEASRERARKEIAEAKRLHLKVFTMGDVLSFPSTALAILNDDVTADNDPTRYCLGKPKTQALLESALNEVLTDFPEIDIIMVRTGENYSDGPIMGNTPLDGSCSQIKDLSPSARLRLVIDTIRHEVVDVHGKTYVHRAWDLGKSGFHADPKFAASVVEGISPDKFILSFKQTETDFWRYNPVNANFGQGSVSQMAEFQVAREFEGKGAFPNYMGEVFAYGGQEVKPAGGVKYAYDHGVRAAWVWAQGGGWQGPYLKSNIWLDANTFAISHLLWNPDLSATSMAVQWASLRFGAKAAPKVASMLLKSDDAVVKGFYVGPYAQRSGPWAPNNLWNRDDEIRGGDDVVPLYRASAAKDDFATALNERKEAVKIVDSMIGDLRAAVPAIADKELAQTAMSSLLYEKALFRVFDDYLTGLFYYYHWLDSGKRNEKDRLAARQSLQKWEESWRFYSEQIPPLPGVATLYRDNGMSQAAHEALKDLE